MEREIGRLSKEPQYLLSQLDRDTINRIIAALQEEARQAELEWRMKWSAR
jgi:hypothetical protein